jgi:signal transduction histidine kinase
MKFGISAKLMISFGVIAVLLAALALYSAIVSQKTLEESVGRNSLILVQEMLTRIDQSIYYRMEELQKYANREDLQKILLESNTDFEKLDNIEEYIKQKDQEWTAVPRDEITPFMQSLIDENMSQMFRREFIEFYERKYGYKLFVQVLLTNRYGVNITQTGKSSNYRQDGQEWWQRARDNGTSISDAYYDEYYNTNCIKISIRIVDEKGNFIGVMKAVVSAEETMREAEIALKEHETTKIKLLTGEGKVIYATEPFNFLEDVTGEDYFKKLQEENGVFLLQEGGRKKLYSYARSKGFRTFEGLNWILLINHDVVEVLSSAFILRNNILLFSLLLVLITVLVAFLLSRSMVNPVIQLQNTVQEISQGNLDKRVKVSSKDEIGQLATAFNKMAGKLQESYHNLKKEIIEREKVQEQLARSEKLAILGQLAGGIGHELRNPLGSIKNAAYFLKMVLEKPEPEVKETLEILEKEVAASEHIISSLLDFARSKPPARSKVDVNDLLQEVISHTIIPERIKIVSNLDKSLPQILADPDQLIQVFKNLMLNALQAMPETGQLVIRSETLPPSLVAISFADSGVGISRENQKKLFEPLFTTKAKGIGLGLAITKTLVEGHGGTVEVQSELGEGSIFTVRLPIKERRRTT